MFKPGDSLTVQNANDVLDSGLLAIVDGQREFDLGEISTIDSAAVAVLLAWQRKAYALNTQLAFTNLSENLQDLAEMYGVAHFLHCTPEPEPCVYVAKRH